MPTTLDFVSGHDFWVVNATGDWSADNAVGRKHATALLGHMKAGGAPNLLGSVVRSMVNKGVFGGVETGFCAAISAKALRGL